ncbi:hypothetical protein BOTBODRAFT_70898 [Botryobasidium botryosum FD-172 SS1]|uniref:Uncharacterized protein n=1 Tax=Botryobasidium botryosum (strain FD-172 SS1) TaxID=930990 RepID=A0A067LTH1_BOTB1|nr:hypothetical protein BOTBODRAFT_70898 [Botryobasidium botryosum FD-172 SS1]
MDPSSKLYAKMQAAAAAILPQLMMQALPQNTSSVEREDGQNGRGVASFGAPRAEEKCWTMVDEKCAIIASVRDAIIEAAMAHSVHLLNPLQTRFNQLVPISQLPNKLLSYIFVLTVDTQCPAERVETRAQLTIPLVSRQWRQIALDTPGFWTTIDFVTRRLMPWSMAHTKGTPLQIRLDPFCSHHPSREAEKLYFKESADHEGFFAPLLPYIDRWRTLSIYVLSPHLSKPLFPSPVPQLEQLEIAAGLSTTQPPILHNLFANHMPAGLRRLCFEGVYQPLTSAIYVGLTSLKLERVDYRDCDSLCHLLGVLKACPLLEELCLGELKFSESDLLNESQPPLTLPHLLKAEYYRLDNDLLRYFLVSIEYTPSVRLQLETDGQGDGLRCVFLSPSIFATNLPSFLRIRNLEIEYTCMVGLWMVTIKASDGISDDLLDLRLHLLDERRDNFMNRFFCYLARDLPLQHLEALSIKCGNHDQPNAASFAQLLRGLPALNSLSLGYCSLSFVDALIVTPASRLCPLLHTLRITHSDITREELLELATSRSSANKRVKIPSEGVCALRALEVHDLTHIEYDKSTWLERELDDISVRFLWLCKKGKDDVYWPKY